MPRDTIYNDVVYRTSFRTCNSCSFFFLRAWLQFILKLQTKMCVKCLKKAEGDFLKTLCAVTNEYAEYFYIRLSIYLISSGIYSLCSLLIFESKILFYEKRKKMYPLLSNTYVNAVLALLLLTMREKWFLGNYTQ